MSGISAQDRDTQLLSIGKQCSDPSCSLIDFLPFKCQHCAEPFCGEHFSVVAHKCPKYDETKHNRVAPSCPLCNVPVAIPPGLDPNIRMEQHITTECSVMTGKSGKLKSTPVCARPKCKKVLFAPIRCDKCKEQFCPQHRFPADHACAALATTTSVPKSLSGSKPLSNPKSNGSAASMATMTTLLGKSSTSSPSPAPNLVTTSKLPISTSKPVTNPFSKSDRSSSVSVSPVTTDNAPPMTTNKPQPVIDFIRAKAERESKRKAMQERANKGLLSEQEKATLAAEVENAKVEKSGECVFM